jgi:hypothetical protein
MKEREKQQDEILHSTLWCYGFNKTGTTKKKSEKSGGKLGESGQSQ